MVQTNANGDRRQFAELWQMDQTQTFSSVVETANFNSIDARKNPSMHNVAEQIVNKNRTINAIDLAANLRQSGAETDYLKTASHFTTMGLPLK